jgi:cell division protein FtsQ
MDEKILPAPEISIHADAENAFLTSDELQSRLLRSRLLFEGQKREELNVEEIEKFISSISQVKKVEVFQFIDGSWKIDVDMRAPIARIFNKYGETFYLDDEGNVMDVSPIHTARTLIVSGEIKDKKNSISVDEIINNDSLISIRKLDDIYRISTYVCNDPLFHSLIGQVHLKKDGDFVLIPLVGDQEIVFGSAYSDQEVDKKFKKLKIFYKEAMPYEGWDAYREISLKFDGQIVCKKKNTDE